MRGLVCCHANRYNSHCRARGKRNDARAQIHTVDCLRLVLDCQIAFDVLLAEKQIDIVRNRRPFVSGKEILDKRSRK